MKIDSCYPDLNGYEWENLIRNYLPKLEQFQLKMKFQMFNPNQRDQLLKSFQTPFWIKERQWFIQFHFNLDDKSNIINREIIAINIIRCIKAEKYVKSSLFRSITEAN